MQKLGSLCCPSLPFLALGFLLALACANPEELWAQSAPSVTTLPVTNIDNVNASSALAQASVNPNGASTAVTFQYSTDLSYSNVSAPIFVSAGNSPLQVSATIFPALPNTLFHLRAVASNTFGTTVGGDVTFTMPLVAPQIVSGAATNVSANGATIVAQVNPRNAVGGVYVAYGTVGSSAGYGSQSAAANITGVNPITTNISLTGLQPNTTYFYGIVATNSAGSSRLDNLTFTTGPLPPAINSVAATDITGNSMTLRGLVNPNSAPTAVYFQYSVLGAQTFFTPTNFLPAGNTAVPVSAAISSLLPNLCYDWRLVAVNSGGSSQTPSQSACTLGLPPIATTLPPIIVTAQTASLSGQAQPNGLATTAYFQYGTTPAMANSTSPSSVGTSLGAIGFVANLSSLPPNTLYYYRAVAVNTLGTNYGSQGVFTTRQVAPTPVVDHPSNSISLRITQTRQAKAVGYSINGVLSVYLTDAGAGYATTNPPAVIVSLTPGATSNGTVTASVAADGSINSLAVQDSGSYPGTAQVSVIIAPPPNVIQQTLTNTTNAIILLSAGSLDANTIITRDVTIRGQGMDLTTITGGGRDSVFRVMPGVNVTFEDLGITGGVAGNGGGIDNEKGHVIVNRCRINNNHAAGLGAEGGGIYNRGPATCVINNSLIHNNTADRNGGAISSSGLNTTVIPGLAKGLTGASNAFHVLYAIVNDPNAFGVKVANTVKGAVYSLPDVGLQLAMGMSPLNLYQDFVNQIHNFDGKFNNPLASATVSFTSSSVSGVKSSFHDVYGSEWLSFGAAILTINQCQIFDNLTQPQVAGFGGGIHNDVGLVLLTDSELRGNRVKSNLGAFGGALDSFVGAVRMIRCAVHDNEASSVTVVSGGGGIFVAGTMLQIEDSDVSRNNSTALYLSRGGGLQVTAGSQATLLRSTFNQNKSGGGGGLENSYLSTLLATNCTFSSNTISGLISANGGGVANDQGGNMTLVGCTIDHNIATGLCDGGGFYNHCKSDDWSKEFEFSQGEEIEGVESQKLELQLPAQLVGQTTATLINCTISGNAANGMDLNIPNPFDVAQCLAFNQVQSGFCSLSALPPSLTLHLPGRGGGVFNGAESDDPVDYGQPVPSLSATCDLTLSSCTIYGNSASGQDLFNTPIPTFSAKPSGGGVFNTDTAGLITTHFGGADINIGNSIVALNTLNGQANNLQDSRLSKFLNATTSITTDDPNLDTDGSIAQSKTGGNASNLTQSDPHLGPLAYNGGLTRTHAMLSSSAALNAAGSDSPNTDQRGVTRPQLGQPDIGAFEAALPRPAPDSYSCLQGQTLVVAATNGVLANDFGASLVASAFQLPQHGSLTLAADGSFTYTSINNYTGSDSFTYQANDGGFVAFGTVSITVLPVLHLTSFPTNSVTGARDQLSLTFDVPVAPSSATAGILIRGSESIVQPFSAASSNKTLNITPAAGFHPGEVVTVELLKSLVGTNGAGTPSTRIFQYVTQVGSGSGYFPLSTDVGGGRTVAVALSDLDGNGTIDAFVAKDDGDEVWLNDGLGHFTRIQTLPGNSTGVALGDLNGDGFPDAVVTKAGGLIGLPHPNMVNPSYPSDYNRIYFNDGTGHFVESVQQLVTGTFVDPDTAPNPSWFHISPTEIFISSPTGDIYYYNPNNVDLSQFYHYLNEGSAGVAIADLNGDGYLDIFLINRNSQTVFHHLVGTPGATVWLNNGHGVFLRTGQRLGNSGAYAVKLADLDGNGTIDAVVAANDGTEIWFNDGLGNFSRGQTFTGLDFSLSVAVGDLNGDGTLDLVTSDGRRPDLSNRPLYGNYVWLNDSHGNFSPGQSFIGSIAAYSLALGDLSGDGRLDLFACGIFGNEVFLNNGSNFVSNGPKFNADFFGQTVALADLDGDGDLDAFVGNWDKFGILGLPGNKTQIWFNDARPSVNNFNFTVAEEGLLSVPPLGVLAGLNDLDGPSPSLRTTAVRVYTAPTLGALIGLVYNLPDYNVNNYSYDASGHSVYLRTVPVFAQNGALNLRADGSFTYAPNPLFSGTDGFSFVVSDGYLSATGSVTITVTPINHPPTAIADYYDLPGGTLNIAPANGVLANDSDVDGNPLTTSLAQNAAHGSVALNANGSFTYSPNPGYTGPDSFLYRASDGQTNSVARVKLGNSAPIALPDLNYPMPPSGVLVVTAVTGVLANDSDPDGDAITAQLTSSPGHGTVSFNSDGSFTYTRAGGYSGNDVFTYQASDGLAPSTPARVKIGNTAPVATNDGPYVAFLNKPLIVSAAQGVLGNDSDPEGDPLVARLVSGPANGSVTLNSDGSFTYTPANGFSGNDSFTYAANDGIGNSPPAQAAIGVYGDLTVVAVDPPLNAINLPSNTAIRVIFNANVNPSSLAGKFMVHGSLSGFHGFAVTTANTEARLQLVKPFQPGETVEVTVAPGVRGTGFLQLQTGFTWQFTALAPRGSALFSNVFVDSESVSNDLVVAGDFNGDGRPDAFTLNGYGYTAPALYLNNGDRTFSRQSFAGLDNSTQYRLAATGDFDGDGSLDIFVIGFKPTLWLNDGAGHFTMTNLPEAPYFVHSIAVGDFNRDGRLDVVASAFDSSLPDTPTVFWVWLNNGAGNFTVGPLARSDVSFPTIAVGDLNGDGSLDVWLTGFDGDRIWLNDGSGQFRPDSQRLGDGDGVSVALGDLNGDGALDAMVHYYGGARVWLNNGSGKFTAASQLLLETNSVWALAFGDLNGDGSLDAIAVVPANFDGTNGFSIALINDGKGQFTPMAYGFPSYDSRGVAIADFDGNGTLDAFFANGEVFPAPNTVWFNQSRPIARDDLYASVTTSVAAPGVLANDSRGDGASFNAILDTQPTNGSVTLSANGSFTFTPGAGFAGTAVFTYHVSDGNLDSAIARVKIGNSAPTAVADSYVALNDSPLLVPAVNGVLANDSDPEGDKLTAVLTAPPSHGTVRLNNDGSFLYTAASGYLGADAFTYRATDSYATSAVATVSIDVRARLSIVSTAPAANALAVSPTAPITLLFNHPVNSSTAPANLSVSGNLSGSRPVVINVSGSTITLTSPFRPGEQVTVVVSTGIRGANGELLAAPLVLQFTVEAPLSHGQLTDSGQRLIVTPMTNTTDVVLADVDGDGDLDAIVAAPGTFIFTNGIFWLPDSKATMIWRNNSSGVFSDSGLRLGTNRSTAIVSLDANRDGAPDFLVAKADGPSELWLNNGAGSFTLSSQTFLLPGQATSNNPALQVGDFNGDGAPDVAFIQMLSQFPGPNVAVVGIWTNNGAGIFTDTGQRLINGSDQNPAQIVVGDVDGDGDLDILELNFYSGARIWVNDGLGNFTDSGKTFGGAGAHGFNQGQFGDLNGDGTLDFVGLASGIPLSVWFNDGKGNFTDSGQALGTNIFFNIKLADMDGDGTLDILLSQFQNSPPLNQSRVWFNDGTGHFVDRNVAIGSDSLQARTFAIGDLNSDGAPDVFLLNQGQPRVVLFNTAALAPISGITPTIINDTGRATPFSGALLKGIPNSSVTMRLQLDNSDKGALTLGSLAAGGFTVSGAGVYTHPAASLSAAQTALRQLVFAPIPNRKPVGQSEVAIFTIVVNDGATSQTNSGTAVSSISVNDPPQAASDCCGVGFTTTEAAAFITANVLTNDFDIDPGDATNLTVFSLNTGATIGSVSNLGNGTFRYDPNGKFTSLPLGGGTSDFFSYVVNDGHGGYSTGVVSIAINGVNNSPIANDDTISVGERDGAVAVSPKLLLNDSDPDLGETTALTITSVNTAGTHGTLVLASGSLTYNPNNAFGNLVQGATATDHFSYTIQDPHGASATANVTVTVTGQNDTPVAINDGITLNANIAPTNLTAFLLSNDSDPDPGETATLTVIGIDVSKTKGVLALSAGALTYQAGPQLASLPQGSNVVDTFDYIIQDVHGASARATVTVTNIGVNQTPLTVPTSLFVQQGQPATNISALLLANNTDPNDGETATLRITDLVLTGTAGNVQLNTGAVRYAAAALPQLGPSQSAIDRFSYVVSDVHDAKATGAVTVTITGQDLEPSALSDIITIGSLDGPTDITPMLLANDTNPNIGYAGSLSPVSVSTNGSRGDLSLGRRSIIYNAKGHFNNVEPGQLAVDGFSYTVADPFGKTAAANVGVIIVGRPSVTQLLVRTNRQVHLHILGFKQTVCTVLYSTDLVTWRTNGTATETSPGVFDFNDPTLAANLQPRFYRVEQTLVGLKPENIPATVNGVVQSDHQFDLQISGLATNYTAYASSNLVQWTPLGSATKIGPAFFHFTDTNAPAVPNRFYRAKSPSN